MKMIIDLKNKMELIVAFYLIYLIALLYYPMLAHISAPALIGKPSMVHP
jgi:hypothetical protein